MRLLTAGSLVRVQQGEPKRAGRHQSSCSFSLYLLTQTVTLPHTVAPAVNWLGAPRCLRQMKRCSEQEETTSIAKRSKRARRLCFWMKGSLISIHLRCMKNEVASLMKCGQTAWKLKARFSSCEYFMTTKLSLCVCGANISFIKKSLY